MKKLYLGLVIVAIISGGAWLVRPKDTTPNPLDAFAKCLAENGITMYGADSCAFCQAEKKAFGSAFKHVPYVECRRDPQKCLNQRIEKYPTWIFSNSQRLVGKQGLARLSQESGCPLPDDP